VVIPLSFEIIDAIINNPMEAVLLFVAGFMVYKYFGSGRSRMYRKHELSSFLLDVKFFLRRLINSRYESFCRINVERLDEVLTLITQLEGMHNWSQRDFIKAKTNMSSPEVSQLINALINLKIIDWNKEYSLVIKNEGSQVS
jgi:hypothetical protein